MDAFLFWNGIYNGLFLDDLKTKPDYNFMLSKLLFFISAQKKKFRNKFDFIGDNEFTSNLQKQLLSTAWEWGCAGITRIGGKDGTLAVYAVIPTQINNQGEVIKGVGILNRSLHKFQFRKSVERKNFKKILTDENTAFYIYHSDFFSGLMETFPSALAYAEASTALKVNIYLTANRLNTNRDNTDNVNDEIENSIRNFDLVLKTKTNKNSKPYGLLPVTEINPMNEILPLNLDLVKLSEGVQLTEISNIINDIKSDYDEMIGNRTNINFKAERNIQSEFSFSNIHFSLLENDLNIAIEQFIINYEKVFNKKIEAIDNIQEMIEADERLKQTGDDNTSEIINSEKENGEN